MGLMYKARSIIMIAMVAIIISGCERNNKKQKSQVQFHSEKTNKATKEFLVVEPDSIISEKLINAILNKTDFIELTGKGDTLSLITTDDFLYYPFGKMTDAQKFDINSFEITKRKEAFYENSTSAPALIYRIVEHNSYLEIFKDPESGQMQIIKGKLTEPSFDLLRNIHINMGKKDFLLKFFAHVPPNKFKVIELVSGVDGIWHYYSFSNDILKEIEFKTDYTFPSNQ